MAYSVSISRVKPLFAFMVTSCFNNIISPQFYHYPSQALKSSKCNNHYQKHTRCNPSCKPSRHICSRSFLSVFTQHYTMVVVHSGVLQIQNQFSYAGDLKVCVTTRSLFCNLLYLTYTKKLFSSIIY